MFTRRLVNIETRYAPSLERAKPIEQRAIFFGAFAVNRQRMVIVSFPFLESCGFQRVTKSMLRNLGNVQTKLLGCVTTSLRTEILTDSRRILLPDFT